LQSPAVPPSFPDFIGALGVRLRRTAPVTKGENVEAYLDPTVRWLSRSVRGSGVIFGRGPGVCSHRGPRRAGDRQTRFTGPELLLVSVEACSVYESAPNGIYFVSHLAFSQ